MTLSPGMLIRVKLEKTIDARRADVGEQVVAKTIEDLKSNPAKLASKGCQVIGHIVEVTPHQGNSASTLKIVFDKVILKNGSDVALPATIQAVGYPDQFVPTDYSAMTNVMGGTGTMPEIGTGGQAMVAGGDPAQYEGGRMPSIRSNPDLQLPLTAQGLIGISGVTLSRGSVRDSILTAQKKNVKLEDGVQMVLRVSYFPSGEVSTATQTYLNPGQNSNFLQIDFSSMYSQNSLASDKEKKDQENRGLIEAGIVSPLDLKAPHYAIEQYNHATTLLKEQKSKDAIPYLRKAVEVYPSFVSAHIGLGRAYLDKDDAKSAKAEFETAAKLDSMFASSFLDLGRLALAESDFGNAQSNFEIAASIRPKDAMILSNLAYAQNKNHEYLAALETTRRVHALDHKGLANVHSVGAAAALALNDLDALEGELNFLLSEDPTGPMAPAARKNLAVLSYSKEAKLQASNIGVAQPRATVSDSQPLQTFPNADRLKAELRSLDDESDRGSCNDCAKQDTASESARLSYGGPSDLSPGVAGGAAGTWTLRKRVDEVALFFNVSKHGHTMNDLKTSDVRVLDNDKPPEKVLAFVPQSKLPLRLALLVDTSGSVREQFPFEKRAATKFVQKVLNSTSDLAFIAGFSSETAITQDFSSNQGELGEGIQKLANGGGTALFDAVSLACWKLAKYPDDDRVARVVVILSDGEDNSSRTTLKQAIQITEKTNVTIYTINTNEHEGPKTDADRILEELAERSGGEAINMPTLGSSFDKVNDLIRSRYFIAYKPADFRPDGSYRTIRVSASKNGEQLQVRARKGYHARLEVNPN